MYKQNFKALIIKTKNLIYKKKRMQNELILAKLATANVSAKTT